MRRFELECLGESWHLYELRVHAVYTEQRLVAAGTYEACQAALRLLA
jgi:hypothetical protein